MFGDMTDITILKDEKRMTVLIQFKVNIETDCKVPQREKKKV